MERAAGWRAIDPQEEPDDGPQAADGAKPEQPANDGLKTALAALIGAGVLVAAGVLLWAGTPQPQVVLGPGGQEPPGLLDAQSPTDPRSEAGPSTPPEMIVDVQGAVTRPGLQRLGTGARVGDAIAAAGGYSAQIDVRAAAERLNLAERLVDGAKIYVPARGDPTPNAPSAAAPPASGGDSGTATLIDVNTAGQAQLETLPGVGPVTAGKIIGAREEAPFTTVDDLLARKVVGPATFEKIKPLITVSP